MKTIALAGILVGLLSGVAGAWTFEKNPDRVPSFGMEIYSGKLAGIQKDVAPGAPSTDGGFVQGKLDLRLPVSSYFTLSLIGESTGINNNLEFSNGHRIGAGFRVYMQ